MIASGLVLVIPALLTTILAGGCGVLFASIAWVQLRSGPISKTPVAMFTFAASTAINVVSLPVILCLPYDLQDGYIFGFHAMSFIWSFFLVVSFVLAIATTRLLSSYSGLGREALRTGSIVLIVLYVLGLVGAYASC
jgi:hypothetical protein